MKTGRNDHCHCGSGKKYKKCCLENDQADNARLNSPHYMVYNAHEYPLDECFIRKNWEEDGLATILVVRQVPETKKYLFATFMLDTFCLGLKDAFSNGNVAYTAIEQIIDKHGGMDPIDYEKCRELILGSISFAKNLGFDPHEDWEQVKTFIEWDKPCEITRKFGKDGKPSYISGPNDNVVKIIKKLEGKEFDYMLSYEQSKQVESAGILLPGPPGMLP